jgi:hypothetical protein
MRVVSSGDGASAITPPGRDWSRLDDIARPSAPEVKLTDGSWTFQTLAMERSGPPSRYREHGAGELERARPK